MLNLPNAITISRIILSFMLLFVKPQSILFFVIYIVCGATDLLDGYIARKKKITSSLGATLDSIADFIFIFILLLIYLPILNIPQWCWFSITVISIIRLSSLLIGFIKYRAPGFLHTYTNKATGILLFCSPLIYVLMGTVFTGLLLCVVASVSAIEELAINMASKELSKDIKNIFKM